MIAYETKDQICMVSKIEQTQLNNHYVIKFNDVVYKKYSKKEEAENDFYELKLLWYSKKLNIIKG